MRLFVATLALGGIFASGCGSVASPGSPMSPGPSPSADAGGVFVVCPGSGIAAYEIQDSPHPGCKPLVAGSDYADGRVIIGVKAGSTDAQITPALVRYKATVVSSQAAVGQKVLAVPDGTVPQAVVGLAGYDFIVFAAPDLLAHTTNPNT